LAKVNERKNEMSIENTKAKKRKTSTTTPPPPAPITPAAAITAIVNAPTTTEYTMTEVDRNALARFEEAATTYERSSHNFAVAAFKMKENGLHIRSGYGDFGAFCAATFSRLSLKHIEARQAANLATVGEALANNPSCKELGSLPSTAILRLAEKFEDIQGQCEGIDTIADAAVALKKYMADNGTKDAARAAIDLAEYGPEGDQRSKEERKADADGEAEEKIRTAVERLVRTDRKKLDALVTALAHDFAARCAKKTKKTKKSKRAD
jgi:hypothetical protein